MKLNSGQYYGEVFQSMDVNGIILTKSNYEKESALPKHYHRNPYFCYVLEGSYIEHSNKNKLACSKGDIVFHPSETEHHNHFNDRVASCFNIELSDAWPEKLLQSDLRLSSITSSNQLDIQKMIMKIYREFLDCDSLSDLMIEGLTIEMMVNFSREANRSISAPYYIKKVTRYIDERYSTNPSLSELASLFHISPEYLTRVFKRATGVTIGEYMRHFRIQKACEKLKEENADILCIALECGFTDQSHFTKTFKKIMSITPKQYRLTNKQFYTKISRSY